MVGCSVIRNKYRIWEVVKSVCGYSGFPNLK